MSWKFLQRNTSTGQLRTTDQGGGSSTLAGLSDVDLSEQSDGQVLKWDDANSKWVNADESGGVNDVKVNGVSVVDASKNAKIKSYKEVTQSEYNALPDSKLTDGILYAIKDVGNANQFPPLIFSDEEREVGVWRDGKPLYQKTWKLSSPLSVPYNTWTDTDISNAGMQKIIQGFGNDEFDNGGILQSNSFMYLSFAVNAQNYVRVLSARNATITLNYITLLYTKASDIAGSGTWATKGGLSHHYSTSEQIVGTWIDGKPLYEKTFQYQNSTVWTNGQEFNTGLSNIGYCLIKEAMFRDYNQGRFERLPFYQSVGSTLDSYMQVSFNFNTNKLILRTPDGTSWSAINNRYLWVTLQYTKTTD